MTGSINKIIEDHISNLKKPYIPDFGIEEDFDLVNIFTSNLHDYSMTKNTVSLEKYVT